MTEHKLSDAEYIQKLPLFTRNLYLAHALKACDAMGPHKHEPDLKKILNEARKNPTIQKLMKDIDA